MSNLAIMSALQTRLLAMPSGIAKAQTAWPGTVFNPTADVPYQRVSLIPAPPLNYSGLSPFKRLSGIFQVDFCYPFGGGSGLADAQADALAAWFPQGLSATANSVTTRVDRTPEIKSGRVEGDRWVIPVRITYFANI